MTRKIEAQLYSTISHLALTAGLAVSLSAVVGAAHAQQQNSSVSLDTINVQGVATGTGEGDYNVTAASSPKQTAPLLDTPQTVTVVPQAIIQETGARNLTEVLRNTPGITFDGGENGFGTSTTNFKLRGFDASDSVFIDGSRDNGSYSRDTFNIERVEVFKGAAADNGRGSAGGYVNMVTKLPSLQNFTAGEVGFGFTEYGNKPQKRGTVDLNYIVAPNTAVRLNALLEDSGIPGRDIAENKAWGVAPSVAFGLGTDFRAFLAYEHLSRRDLPDWGLPGQAFRGTYRYHPTIEALVKRDNFYGLRTDFDHTDSDAVLGRLEYDISENITISNQTRWSHVERISRFTQMAASGPFGAGEPHPPAWDTTPPDASTPVGTSTQQYGRTNTTLTNLTNLSARFDTGAIRHNLSAGIELSREESDGNRYAAITAPGSTDIVNPDPDRVHHSGMTVNGVVNARVSTVAGYLYDTMHLSPQWQITGGLRLEHYKVNISSTPAGSFDGTEVSATTLGGKIGAVYKPVENGSVYAVVGVSHQPPGSYLSNPDISRGSDDQGLPGFYPEADPVRSINYEIGTKWDFFNGRLSTTAALFHTEKRVPITGCTPASSPPAWPLGCAGPTELKGYGTQIAQGLELGIAGDITENWKIFGGFLWMKTEKRYSREQELARMAAFAGDYSVGFRDGFSGDALSFTPEFSANLWTTYHIPQTSWTIGGGLQYVGESWVGRPDDAERIVPNGKFGKLPAYTLVHLMASYEVQKNLHVRFNVDNVADTKHAISANWSAHRVMPGPSRTYRVSTSFKF